MIAADKKLKAAVQRWEEDEHTHAMLLTKWIDWMFSQPKASYMGGIWERQISTVRMVLRAMVGSQALDDKRFHILLCETEAVISSCLIMLVSEDSHDFKVLL